MVVVLVRTAMVFVEVVVYEEMVVEVVVVVEQELVVILVVEVVVAVVVVRTPKECYSKLRVHATRWNAFRLSDVLQEGIHGRRAGPHHLAPS